MENPNENYKGEDKTLSIFCIDFVEVKARITFDSHMVSGIKMTYWLEDAEDRAGVMDDVFDLLFDDVVRVRGASSVKTTDKD